MTISAEDREKAVVHLVSRYTNLANEIGQSSLEDNINGWKPDIDQAESRMGGGGCRLAFYSLCEYYAIERFATMLSTRVDTNAYSIEGDRETIFTNIERLRKRMAATVAGYGYPVDMTDLKRGDIGVAVSDPCVDIVGEIPPNGGPQQVAGIQRDWVVIDDVDAASK